MRAGLAIVLGLALAWSAAAEQAPAPKAGQAKLAAADTNKDGKVSFEELSAVRPGIDQNRFKMMDRNGDGFLSPEDRASKPEGQPTAKPVKGDKRDHGARLKACDTNSDGKVTTEEFKAGFPKAPLDRFAKLDRDKDGVLTTTDLPHGAAAGQTEDARHALAAKLRKADADGDGKVTFAEASTAKPGLSRADFDGFDRNKDGFVSKEDRVKQP